MRAPGHDTHDPPLWAWIMSGVVFVLSLVSIGIQAWRLI